MEFYSTVSSSYYLQSFPEHSGRLHSFGETSFFASSLNIRFRILPEAFFGIASTHLMPPSSILYDESLSLIYSCTSFSLGPLPPCLRVM